MDLNLSPMERNLALAIGHSELLVLYEQLQMSYQRQSDAMDSLKQEMVEYKTQARYWEAQFKKFKTREEELKRELEEVKAQLRKREQQIFGRSSESQASTSENTKTKNRKNKRGQQANNPSPARREYNDLEIIEEFVELAEEDRRCPCCHLVYEELAGTEDSEILELVDVKAHKRNIHRKRYKRCCRCSENSDPQIITIPTTERVLPKSKLGISIWVHVLLHKYEFQMPLQRILLNLSMKGLSLSVGTITGGLEKMLGLLSPIYDGIVAHNVAADHWHADETGWKVFEKIDGKNSANWYLWIFHNRESVVYRIRPTRSSKVLKEYFGEDHEGGILNVDRYGAYKVIAKTGIFMLAFCWAHVRRDFLDYAKGFPDRESWALNWIENIAKLYHINNERIQFKPHSKLFQHKNLELKNQIKLMLEQAKKELDNNKLWESAKKILKSLLKHWDGLTLFMEHPEIPMDNNTAERGLRSSVVGRKNYYGSGSIWSAELAAVMFSILKTLKLWNINPETWFQMYFYDCAMSGAQVPNQIERYLPWNMSPKIRATLSKPAKTMGNNSS